MVNHSVNIDILLIRRFRILASTKMASNLVSVSEIPTISILYKLKRLDPALPPYIGKPSQTLNDTVAIIRNDITKLNVDCIVNAANESLLGGGGVDGAIHRAAGPDLVFECNRLNGCKTGNAKITSAYSLPCQKVIHTVGPIYRIEKAKGGGQQEILLRSCYRRSLQLAVENGLKTIAFPAISTGVYGYPSNEAARVAIVEVRNFLEESNNRGKLERVIFCNFERKDEEAYRQLIPYVVIVLYLNVERSNMWGSDYFPPAEQNLSFRTKSQTKPDVEGESSSSPETLVARLPDPPTAEPVLKGQPEAKKQKVGADDTLLPSKSVDDLKSEDDWEEVEKDDVSPVEQIDDDPVEVDKAPSTADVRSVHSSGVDFTVLRESSSDGMSDADE
jgi:O-acetyl-ADP-ribose deacetylase